MTDSNYKVSKPDGYGIQDRGDYLDGTVATPLGYVKVYSQGGSSETPATSLQFIWDGRHYYRSFDHRYTARRLVTLASRFARDVQRETF